MDILFKDDITVVPILVYSVMVDTRAQSLVLKGLCHEISIFWKVYNNKQVLSVHAMIDYFCFLVEEKIKLKVLACSFEITKFENPSSNLRHKILKRQF